MDNSNGGRRRISSVAGVIFTAALGVVMGFLGLALCFLAVRYVVEGGLVDVLLGLVTLALGAALIGIPLAILTGQLRSMFGRRG